MNGCVFCQVARGEIRSAIIYEDAEVIGLMDICPIRPGHAQIIPRGIRSDCQHGGGLGSSDAQARRRGCEAAVLL
jgi:diadenosine tetraphosphate (Ap4A) HIT family hydrolase